MDEIFIDSGIFIHLFDYLDISSTLFSYKTIKENYDSLLKQGKQFITTNFIVAETLNNITKTLNKLNTPYNFDWMLKFFHEYVDDNLIIHLLDNSIIHQSLKICEQNAQYKYSFIDASCFAFLQKYGFVTLFTIDESWTYYNYLKGFTIKPVGYVDIFSKHST